MKPWLKTSLKWAGYYNFIWGGIAILFPIASFEWLGMEPPRYPQLWQCIGMIVGVYGLGYLIAARNPYQHWPIILVGLLGKVFGPLGFAHALMTGQLPWIFGVHLITNDFIWWIPFFLLLKNIWEKEKGHQHK